MKLYFLARLLVYLTLVSTVVFQAPFVQLKPIETESTISTMPFSADIIKLTVRSTMQ